MNPQATPTFDDLEIANDEVLFRFCKTHIQLSRHKETGQYILSDQVFTAWQEVVVLSRLSRFTITEAGETAQSRYDHHSAFALVSITVERVRTLQFNSNGKAQVGLKVAYTPIAAGEPDGPNSYRMTFSQSQLRARKRRSRKIASR